MTIGELHYLYGVTGRDMAVLCDMVKKEEISSVGAKILTIQMFDHRDPHTRTRMIEKHGAPIAHVLFDKLDVLLS
jgi:hypothetical protein